jgi:hypothetical protein
MSYLVARAALDAAQKMFNKARAGAKAAPGDKAKAKASADLATALTAAYTATIAAAAGEPSLQAKRDELITAKVIHHEKYEKKTVQTDDKPDDAPASGAPGSDEGGESSAGADAAPATVDSARPSGMPPAKPKEKKGAKKAESEEDEEQAIAASYTRANGSYRREMAGKNVDALGVLYGPEALARACMKALGTGSIRETFGALATLPEKLQANASIAVDVEALKKRDRAARVEVMIDKAKADGVPVTKERREYLRAQGALHGTAHLRGMIAQYPRLPTKALEPDEEGSTAQLGSAGADVEKAIAEASSLMPAGQRAEFETKMRASLRANAAKIPAA